MENTDNKLILTHALNSQHQDYHNRTNISYILFDLQISLVVSRTLKYTNN
jgi:hypothetical protein